MLSWHKHMSRQNVNLRLCLVSCSYINICNAVIAKCLQIEKFSKHSNVWNSAAQDEFNFQFQFQILNTHTVRHSEHGLDILLQSDPTNPWPWVSTPGVEGWSVFPSGVHRLSGNHRPCAPLPPCLPSGMWGRTGVKSQGHLRSHTLWWQNEDGAREEWRRATAKGSLCCRVAWLCTPPRA